MKRLKKARIQVLKYSAFFGWYLRDVVRLFKHRLALIVLANLVGITFQANAVFLSYKYARSLEKGTIIELAGWSMDPRTSVLLLACTAFAVLFLLLASSLLIMRARLGAIRLGREYGDFCSQRIYLLASRLPSGLTPTANEELTPVRISQMARRDSQLCALTLRIIVYALLPAGTVIVAGVTMFVVDPWLSLVVCSILAAISLQLYRMSVQGAKERSLIERRARDVPRERRQLIDRVAMVPAPLETDDDVLKSPYRNGALALFGDALENQRRVLERSFVTAQAAMGVAVFLVLLIQGGATLRDEGNWSSLIVYLVILSLFATNFAKTVRTLTSVNRFYPPVSRYARFVQVAQRDPGRSERQAVSAHRIAARAISEEDGSSIKMLEVDTSRPVGIIAETAVNRYLTKSLAESIQVVGDGKVSALADPLWFVSLRRIAPGTSLQDACGLSKDFTRSRLSQELEALGQSEIATVLPSSLDEPLSEEQCTGLGERGAFLVTLIAGRVRMAPVEVIDAGGLATLDRHAQAAIVSNTVPSLKLIVHDVDALSNVGTFGESVVLLADPESVHGYCTVQAVRDMDPAVAKVIARLRAKGRSRKRAEAVEMQAELEDML